MAKKDRLIKSKSIYTIRKQHALTNDATIYENDHITIIPNDGIYDDEMALFSESNFKYRIRTEKNEKKRHVRGEYVKPDGKEDDFWTLGDLSATTETEESKIVLKPNYTSLKDFAYYGSAVELIKATVNDIIQRFPGGITNYPDKNIAPKVKVGNTEYTLLSNEFEIDCWTGGDTIASADVKNPMRVLAASYMNYVDKAGNALTAPPVFEAASDCPNSIIGYATFADATFPVYMDAEGKKYLLDNGSEINLKPKQEIIDAFWDSLDDFERVLLSRDTTPVYKATFETPYSDETGYYYKNKSYVWPTIDGFTPDISTGNFQGYLASLVNLATFHDEHDSDNIWRMMTHESIKNLNWTFTSEKDGMDVDMSDIDSEGIGAMIRIYGRQFDDIKRYADNIKMSNSISYDEKNNMPDYFLSDTVENDGWEAQNTTPFVGEFTDSLSGYTSGKTSAFVNSSFLRRLALSSDYIQSMKGTRRGIETLLGLFGYVVTSAETKTKGEFCIKEYVAIISSALPYTEAYTIRTMGGDYVNVDEETNFMKGYPVAVVRPATSGESTESSYYLVPWYDKKQAYDYPFYFQGNGGWGKRAKKILANGTPLTSDLVDIYGETQPYMKYATTIEDMLSFDYTTLVENTVCYVTDISTMEKDYIASPSDNGKVDFSHYFILKNKILAGYCGFVNNDLYNCYGWRNIYENEIEGLNGDGPKVVYLESLIADYKGNNPHVGYGQYDDGEEYIYQYQNLFNGMFKDGKFDYLEQSNETIGGLNETGKQIYERLSKGDYGFKLEAEVEDNKKCNYYIDTTNTESSLAPTGVPDDIEWSYPNGLSGFKPEEIEENPDGILDESQANGLINIKKLVINFGVDGDETMIKYLQTVVFKYLEQMIPSTAILEYRFDGMRPETKGIETQTTSGTYSFIRTAHAVLDKNNENVIIWREHPTTLTKK